jgi:hypothetical protein
MVLFTERMQCQSLRVGRPPKQEVLIRAELGVITQVRILCARFVNVIRVCPEIAVGVALPRTAHIRVSRLSHAGHGFAQGPRLPSHLFLNTPGLEFRVNHPPVNAQKNPRSGAIGFLKLGRSLHITRRL